MPPEMKHKPQYSVPDGDLNSEISAGYLKSPSDEISEFPETWWLRRGVSRIRVYDINLLRLFTGPLDTPLTSQRSSSFHILSLSPATMTTPARHTALKVLQSGKIGPVSSRIPDLRPDEVLVHVRYVALNPFDAKSVDLSPSVGATVGCDFSGDVVATGSPTMLKPRIGDRVSGCVFGNNPDRLDNGAFAEYVAIPAELLFVIPKELSYEAAATLGVGLATVGMALYLSLGLPLPGSSSPTNPSYVLVYGGSTATGTLAIQMLRRSGLTPIATCSPHNFALVKSLGATAAFDYKSPTCGAQIREFTNGTLAYALDCITDTHSMAICYEGIGPTGGKYLSLDPFPIRGHTRRSVKPNWVLSLTMYNQPINWKRPFKRDARPKDREFAARWFQIAQEFLDSGVIQSHPYQVREAGWENMQCGLDSLLKGEVSGVKLVYPIS
ncbi:chaperonin 10-like protein [Aspergillus avenaceus]|uniref:Chaperonin 10-like protein n=1 Tax=Aspergillus avenaceus TaxID=36643 RepID=A0A5N6U491_ASPAV|nr:chaperonin 10-like protein [Aspergillus avenaceus]